MYIKFIIYGLFLALTGCLAGETTGKLAGGQWTAPMSLGGGKYLIQGYDTEDAITGANSYCSRQGKSISTDSIVPHTRSERASVTFSCN